MKKTVLKMFGLALSVIMIMAVAVVPSLADEPAVEDVVIKSSIFGAGEFSQNAPSNEKYTSVVASQVYDAAMGKNVRRFSSSSYTNQEKPGYEPRVFLAGKPKTGTSLGNIDYSTNTYGYVRITTDLYIDNETNGIAFRFARYDSTTNAITYATNTDSRYVGIGGSTFAASSYGKSYVCNDLVPRKWQRVVIEIGVDSTHRDINFYIDDVKSDSTFELPEGTYGIGTKEGGNYCIFIPKGTKGKVYDVRISDFTIKATVSGYDPATSGFTGYAVNEPYVFNNDATLTRAEKNNITVETTQAPQIDSEVLAKEVVHLSSEHFANCTGGSYIAVGSNKGNYILEDGAYVEVENGKGNYIKLSAGNYMLAQYLPVYSLVGGSNAKLGNVDYSDYTYLRFRFNIFVNDSHNGVILRLSRYGSDDTTVYTPDYVFGIGASDFANITYSASSAETYQCRQLTVGKWNDVLLELGVKANDSTMRIYINGEEKAISERTDATFGVNNGTGYCGVSANRCAIIPKSSYGEPLDMYLSDVSLTVAKEAYNIENVVYPSVECASEDAVVYGSGVYTRNRNNVTDEIFTKGDATSYAGVINDAESGEPARVISYNNAEKTFKYYNIVTEGFITKINSADYSGADTDVNAMVINVDGNIKKATLVVAYYKENEGGDGASLVMAKFFDENISNLYSDINETADKPEADFDYVKVFALRGVGNMKSIGRARSF